MSYNPGVVDRSGEIMANGISNAVGSIADTIDLLGQRHRQLKAYQTMAVDGLGMDKDEVGKMSLPQIQGIMQGEAMKSAVQQRKAQAQLIQEKAANLQTQQDEAGAMGAIAPVMQDWMQKNPGKQPAATDIMGFMQTAKLNPRAQSAIMQKLIPAMMNGEGGGAVAPQFITSPSGNHYAVLKNSMMNDNQRPAMDDSQVPDGYEAVPDGKGGMRYLRAPAAKTIPPAAQNKLTEYLNDYSSANDILNSSDADLKANPAGLPAATLRAGATARLKRTQTNAKNLLDMQQKLGALDDDTHGSFLQQFGLGGKAAAAPPAAGAAGGRVQVWDKTGKAFTVPAEQKDAAVQAGYLSAAPVAQ
jgi:hypothetical protein